MKQRLKGSGGGGGGGGGVSRKKKSVKSCSAGPTCTHACRTGIDPASFKPPHLRHTHTRPPPHESEEMLRKRLAD